MDNKHVSASMLLPSSSYGFAGGTFFEGHFLHKLLAIPRKDAGLTVHDTLHVTAPSTHRAGATPTQTLYALREAQSNGLNITALLDGIADRRASQNLSEGSSHSYHSHLNQIRHACELLCEDWLPAALHTIRRVTSVVNNPSTLRGWLAAWRYVHIVAGATWLGDGDLFLRAVRLGLLRHVGPPPMRMRMQAPRLIKVLRYCINNDLTLVGAAAALAYIFALRVPSELLRQAGVTLFTTADSRRIQYGPIRRKGQPRLTTLTRWCTCDWCPLLCAHPWVAYLRETTSGDF